MRKFLILIVITCFFNHVFSQVSQKKTFKQFTLFGEALGAGQRYSINCDFSINKTDSKNKFTISAGYTHFSHYEVIRDSLRKNWAYYYFPFELNYRRQISNNSSIDMGLVASVGRTFDIYIDHPGFVATEHWPSHYFWPEISYRFQKPVGGIFSKFSIYAVNKYNYWIFPPFPYDDKYHRILPWFGLSVGYTFKQGFLKRKELKE